MNCHGIPKVFWIVTKPTKDSVLADIFFDCDLERYATQIRGGLDEKDIVGVFAVRKDAEYLAKLLFEAVPREQRPYYVAALAKYVLVQASSRAREALEAGEKHPELLGSVITAVRPASNAEIELVQFHEEQLAKGNN